MAQPNKVSRNKVEDLIVPHVVLQLEHVLNKVVAIGVLNQVVDTADDNVGQGQLLHLEALLEAALHHAAAVLVGADLVTVGHACPEDELCIGCICLRSWAVGLLGLLRSFEGQEEGLNDMVAIWVCRELEDVVGHLGADGKDLIVEGRGLVTEHLDEGLDDTSAMKVH